MYDVGASLTSMPAVAVVALVDEQEPLLVAVHLIAGPALAPALRCHYLGLLGMPRWRYQTREDRTIDVPDDEAPPA